jgi:hypothetical protein
MPKKNHEFIWIYYSKWEITIKLLNYTLLSYFAKKKIYSSNIPQIQTTCRMPEIIKLVGDYRNSWKIE